MPQLNRILALKELGLTLEQIKRMLHDDISADEIRGMLALKKAQVEQTLLEEIARIKYIESRIEQIDRDGKLDNYDIVLKSIPSQRYLSMRQIFSDLTEVQLFGVEMYKQLPAKVGRTNIQNIMVVIHSESWEDDNLDMEIGFIVSDEVDKNHINVADAQMTLHQLPPMPSMLTLVRVGRPSLGHGNYSVLGDWVNANGYRFSGSGREVFFQFPFPDREHEAIAEIQFPVEKITPQLST